MTFGRQKRLLLGILALLAPLPLPFNEVVAWPVVAAYMVGVVYFLRRASLDTPRWLPLWAMNMLGLVYLPLFFLDLLVLTRGRLLQPVLHLILFALLVKLFALTRERDKWQAAVGIFFLFLASMGTSVHPTIVLYLLSFLVLTLVMLTRFAFLHVLAGFGREDPELARIPLGGFLAFCTLLTVVLAVPLFAFLPRVPSPYIVGRGSGLGQTIEAAGFSDEVSLDSIGQIRSSRDVALRLLDEGGLSPDREIRFKASTYDVYQGGTWRRSPGRAMLQRDNGMRFTLDRRPPVRWARIYLPPLRSSSLPLPVETAVVEPRSSTLLLNEGGAVSFGFNPVELVEYRVGMINEPVLLAKAPSELPSDPALDLAGVTPRISALARSVMGQGTPAARAQRLESHLNSSYEYTLDFRGRSAVNPIEDFLFRYKSGQCEYFASSMVLMLRSQGIPARLVTGFLGGEYNPFEGYYIVRDSNAHAWVEAYVAGQGWRIYDPTPPAGRPSAQSEGIPLLMRQAWDFVVFRWDRYVLTFGLYDQLRIFGSLRQMWTDLWKVFDRQDGGKPDSPAVVPTGPLGQATPVPDTGMPKIPLTLLLGLIATAAAVVVIFLKLRPPLTATRAYTRLRRRLGRSLGRNGAPLPDSAPPLAVRAQTAHRFPEAAEPAAKVIAFYLRESFGGEPLADDEREALKTALQEAERGMRKAG